MVYMHFPHSLTEEEELLQRKYAKLRKKKKALAVMRAAARQEPVQPIKVSKKQPSEAAANATEQAKKLLKAGAIKVAAGKKDSQSFKRSKRQKDTEKSAVGYQPFPPTHMSDTDDAPAQQPEGRRSSMKGLYESFISSRDRKPSGDRERDFERRDLDREPPKKGNTVYVRGHGLTEEILRKAFSNVGDIMNVTMERNKKRLSLDSHLRKIADSSRNVTGRKSCAFVTFEKMDSADKAISEMNGTMVFGVHVNVSMARRQPSFDGASTDPASSGWASIAASHSQKGGHQGKREMMTYDNDIF